MAQLDTSGLWVNIDSIYVTATKIEKVWLRSAQAISDVQVDNALTSPNLSLKEVVTEIPGVFSLAANNLAQDLRISIRGFGSRAGFGVRGIKLVVDGIPETTPDGQGQLDAIPLSLLSSVEAIRGPASLLYGNASGGVLSMKTLSGNNLNLLAEPYMVGRLMYGSFGTIQGGLTYGKSFGHTTLISHVNHTSSQGYRDHSAFSNTIARISATHSFTKFSKIRGSLDFTISPEAQDPGALTAAQMATGRKAPNSSNLLFDAGERVRQMKAALSYSYKATEHNTFDSYAFYIKRDFEAGLPFYNLGLIDLDRKYLGQGTSYTVEKNENGIKKTLKYGYDVATQIDLRKRSTQDSLSGMKILGVDQEEKFKTVGIYALGDFNFGSLSISGGLRFDHHTILLDDRYIFDDDRSGRERFTAFNPSLGINYAIDGGIAVFASFSTGFDTPTLTELEHNPLDTFGFNNGLIPQKSINFDVGMKFQYEDRIRAQAVLFRSLTSDELVPFERMGFPGRDFYRNVGSTSRQGVEFEIDYTHDESLSGRMAYTFGIFKFEDYDKEGVSLNGNILPGIPTHMLNLNVDYKHTSGLNASTQLQWVGGLYGDDENTLKDKAYLLADFSLNYLLDIESYTISPFIGLRNLFNSRYNDNVRINAFGGKYFEPGPGLNFFCGVQMKL